MAILPLVLAGCESNSGSSSSTGKVTDICGNTYKTVKIGSQVWMAENLKCNKYDTESEMSGSTIPVVTGRSKSPGYIDATDKSNWTMIDERSENLSSDQISKLGYLYNWAAVVGEPDSYEQKSEYSGHRQGICPNGWHVPSAKEFSVLVDAMGGNGSAGKAMKTKSGWFGNGNGTDSKGFSGLPAGYCLDDNVSYVGVQAYFWTSSVFSSSPESYSDIRYLGIYDDECSTFGDYKKYCSSVRCVKN